MIECPICELGNCDCTADYAQRISQLESQLAESRARAEVMREALEVATTPLPEDREKVRAALAPDAGPRYRDGVLEEAAQVADGFGGKCRCSYSPCDCFAAAGPIAAAIRALKGKP